MYTYGNISNGWAGWQQPKLTRKEIFDQLRDAYIRTENDAVRQVLEITIVRMMREGV